MKGKRTPTWSETLRQFRWIWPVLLAAAAFFLFHTANAASWYWKYPGYKSFGTEYDSLWYVITGTDNKVVDWAKYTSTVVDSTLLNADSAYTAHVSVHDGTVWSDWSAMIIPRLTGGSVSMSSADYDSIEARLVDGSGPYQVVVHCQDSSSGDAAIAGALVTFMDPALSYNVRQGRTNASGNYGFYTSAESLAVLVEFLPGYAFPTIWDTINTTVPATTLVEGYSLLTPGTPTDPNLCRCWGHVAEFVDTGGYALAGNVRVSFSLPENAIDTCGESFAVPRSQSVYSNDTGYFQIDLIPTSCLGGKKYTLRFEQYGQLGRVSGQTTTWQVTVPDSGSYRLTPNALRKNN
jgi:hypothetical protein